MSLDNEVQNSGKMVDANGLNCSVVMALSTNRPVDKQAAAGYVKQGGRRMEH